LLSRQNALALFPDLPETTELTRVGVFPAVNVAENPASFIITAELPGLKANDVRVHIWERRSGSFQRSFPFPGGVAEDKITADFKDGVLTIQLPKAAEEQAKRRSIKINAK
jgi:HSP20 family protein